MKSSSAPVSSLPSGKGSVVAFAIEELTVGGAESMVVAMANEFVNLGWQVHVVCLRDAGVLAAKLNEQIQVHILDKKPGFDIALALRLNRCIRKIGPDVVNSHLWVGNTWTRVALFAARLPIVVTEHSRDSWKPPYYRWIDRILSLRTAALITVSGDTADFYQHEIGLRPSLITVVNNGVDTLRYAQGDGRALRKEWLAYGNQSTEIPADKQIIIGTVGRIVEAKNHRRLIDVMSILKSDPSLAEHDLRLVMVGDGEDRPGIEQYVRDKGLQEWVVFTGSRQDIPDVLAAFDLFTLSSDREGHPLTALEAQAAGTPVVLTDAGGAREAIARDAANCGGVLVEKSTNAMAAAIREMILHPELRQERAVFAREFALQHFDQKQMIKRYEDIFLAAMGS
ncbi:glycosyltransferase [Granulosicoccus antarcticus]|uniref:Glycosyltransferase EpsF n=1 Tax=Granulosicoccus antarcticus IMCC3135 TaxID=1192854 RepID=A0A2Z2P2F8_9GAMM|nr:glycosyltransferase [Granulosicoccus antarcticus]ASJ74737.1 Putative glycosyltransferase EpsF [Granulosicoccus antarcticus IMCC3135]